ncbi:uncharacterized protein LOC129595817 isoform X2 [Paramacrobiotus metropolitanus]|uniref:uncharacterized protein LOC129595817 isoform X2 n=1 Tax=Paramacrobiotus metropolitanus TaxID=2943436 RepID=UPI0024463F83|nr:uncharacterized protein LOC129595817 isoform X2 [Paramacrobiotus metropolitanus]
MAIRLIDLIGISVFLIAITSVVAAGYTLFGNALEAIGFVVSGFVGTVFGVISVPFVAIKSVVAVQWALFDAIRFVANIVLDVVCVPLIAIKSNVVAAENALFDAIHSFEMGVYFEVVQVWLVRLLISLFCMAFVAYIARLVWTNRWGLTGFVRNGHPPCHH